MIGRVVLAEDGDGNRVAVGPVRTDQSVDQLRREIAERGWTVLDTVPHYSRADFTGANGRGMGPVRRNR